MSLGWLGWEYVVLGFFAANVIGAVVGVALIATKRMEPPETESRTGSTCGGMRGGGVRGPRAAAALLPALVLRAISPRSVVVGN